MLLIQFHKYAETWFLPSNHWLFFPISWLVSVSFWMCCFFCYFVIHRSPASCLGLCNASLLQYATCLSPTGPAQQLMSLKTLRWVVVWSPSMSVCGTLLLQRLQFPLLMASFRTAPPPILPRLILIPLTAWTTWFKIGKYFALLTQQYRPYTEKWNQGLLSLHQKKGLFFPPYFLNTESSEMRTSSFIYFTTSFSLPCVGQ